jgi:hypothetical protein
MNKAITRLGAAISCVLVTIALTPLAKADEWDKKTVITTSQPIEIEGKVLQPGQYVMRLLDSSDRHILQVFDVNQAKVEMTILAIPAYRQEPTGDTRLTFSETPTGQVRALRTWFYPGNNSGLEFSIR